MLSDRKFPKRRLLGCGVVLLSAGCVWFAVHTAVLLWRGFADDARNADAMVVLGNKVERDGAPSPRLQRRLDCANTGSGCSAGSASRTAASALERRQSRPG